MILHGKRSAARKPTFGRSQQPPFAHLKKIWEFGQRIKHLKPPMSRDDFRYEHFFELSPDLLCIAGYDGYFKKINPAVSRTLGYSMEELYARPINDFVHEDDKEVTEKVRDELRKARPLYNFENRYRTKTGDVVWLSWTSLPIDAEGLVYAIAKNVSFRKKLEAERNDLLTSLTEINSDLRHLTYTTSHDLRAPVNNMLSLFDLMDTTRVNDQDTLELLEILRLAGEKLKQTLNNYVDLLHEKDATHVRTEELDLAVCLQEVLDSISSLVSTSNASIQSNFTRVPKIVFNKAYLRSIFLNLITNSIKYARPDRSPVITIHTEKTDAAAALIFRDNGLGFDMEKVKHEIFGLHRKFHSHTDSKGIGLYLVHSHVTSLGGSITVESTVNEGTTFRIVFRGR